MPSRKSSGLRPDSVQPQHSKLVPGTYSAGVTVFAPGAVDSPQDVIVVAQVGGSGLANTVSLDSYLTSGSTRDVEFTPLCYRCSPALWLRQQPQVEREHH